MFLSLFIDSQDIVWINANPIDEDNGLSYYKDNQWYSFSKSDFGRIYDINESADGNILLATAYGLYEYDPSE